MPGLKEGVLARPSSEVRNMWPSISDLYGHLLTWPKARPRRQVWLRLCDADTMPSPVGAAPESRIPAEVQSASKTAIHLLAERSFASGTRLDLELSSPKQPATHVLTYVRRSTHRARDHRWAVQCLLPLRLPRGDVEWLRGTRRIAREQDRRRWSRWPFDGTAQFRSAGNPEAAYRHANVIDISFGGAGLLMSAPTPEVGATLELVLDRGSPWPPVTLHAVVCYVRQHPEGDWAIGCRFLREIGWHELGLIDGLDAGSGTHSLN